MKPLKSKLLYELGLSFWMKKSGFNYHKAI